MRAGLALAFALVALIAIAASATAVPPSAQGSVAGSFAPVTLRIAQAAGPPADAVVRAGDTASPDVGLFGDVGAAPVPTPRARPNRVPDRGVVLKATRPPFRVPDIAGGGASLRGSASWYCNSDGSRGPVSACHHSYPDTGGFDAYAAAGPKLRAALGSGWRGRVVSVDGIAVKLVDWCQCYAGQSNEKLIDVYYDVYRRVGGSVTIRW